MKRAFDFVCALAGLVLLSPVLILITVLVWAEDRRSPFFFGRRVTKRKNSAGPKDLQGSHSARDVEQTGDFQFFYMVKFRTMIPDAWKSGVSSTANGDRRITRVGSVLRRAKLDELPQLWNVLVGDMSLVGPRPQVEPDARLYTPVECRMLSVRPGVTDLASIVFSDEGAILEEAGAAKQDAGDADLLYNQLIRPWKSRLALLYIERSSVASDVYVIWLTLLGAVSRARALDGVARILRAWKAEPILQRMSLRRELPLAWPPPGAGEIVQRYPQAAIAADLEPQLGMGMPPTASNSGHATHA